MTILPGAPVTTNWQVAMYQTATTGLIAKYGSKIDGIIVDYGGGFTGAVAAYKSAGVKMPPVATNVDNQLTCELMNSKDKFVEYTSGNKQVVNALQQGIAALEGFKPLQPALYPQHVVFDTQGGPQAQCDPSLPAGAALGEGLSVAQLKQILG
jgi:ABC-type sugar transport system substrate-binding protein